MLQKFRQLNKVEKVVVVFLTLIALLMGHRVAMAFYNEYSEITPREGGLFTEGMVGKFGTLNPLFVQQGSITHDVAQLIFSGLTRYDPKTGTVVPDLAEFTLSSNGKEYTFVIRGGAKWHDGEPVTSDDVVFTYETVIKDPSFKGAILNTNDFGGMKVFKIDERTVKFLLEKPNSFFLVRTLTGLLPAHLLRDIPPSLIGDAPFNLAPIGSGPYQFVSMLSVEDHLEVSLEAFDDFYGTAPHIQDVLFKIFSNEEELMKQTGTLDGVRQISANVAEKILKKTSFVLQHYELPQYVAVFINTESSPLKNKKVRLALQLGTDKVELVKAIGETQIIDTPLLEIDQKNWVHQFSLKKANGALFDTEWKLPEQEKEQETVEPEKKEEEPTYINGPNGGRDFKTTENKVTLTGTAPARTKAIAVNDYTLQKFTPGQRSWSYVASAEFGNFKKGDNRFEVYGIDYQEKKTLLDSMTITYNDEETLAQMDSEKRAQENEAFTNLPTRMNREDRSLTLQLITTQSPAVYQTVAELLQEQWKKMGVALEVYVLDSETFQERLRKRDYDLLLFGQNLGYNLDAYPYWHSSQTKEDGFNLSQFKHFGVDRFLESARLTANEAERKRILQNIQNIMSQEVPAVFLYSPTYLSAHSQKIQNTWFKNLATTSDRLATLPEWYARNDRELKEGAGVFTFFGWLVKQL